MSDRRQRNDYERGRGHGGYGESGHRSGRKGMSLTTIIVVVGVLLLWFHSNDHQSGSGHTPSHSSTVCTAYFKGGC